MGCLNLSIAWGEQDSPFPTLEKVLRVKVWDMQYIE